MADSNSTTAVVLDFTTARAARDARRARPLQGRLLRSAVAGLDGSQRAVLRAAVANGFAEGLTTQQITRSMLRDQVHQKARSAL